MQWHCQCVGVMRNRALIFSKPFDADGAAVFAQACALGLEGIVSKYRGSTYKSGPSAGGSMIAAELAMLFKATLGGNRIATRPAVTSAKASNPGMAVSSHPRAPRPRNQVTLATKQWHSRR